MSCAPAFAAYAIPNFPLIKAGDDILAIILAQADAAGMTLRAGDALVIASKIVSKSEGRCIVLAEVQPSAAAQSLAVETGKDPRLVELDIARVAARLPQADGRLDHPTSLGIRLG